MSKISSAFAVPLASAFMAEPEALNAELRELFIRRSGEGNKHANPSPYTHRNDALFESRFDLFDWPHPAVQKLKTFCLSNLYALIGQLNGYDKDTLARLDLANSAWFHVTERGGYFGVHNHPMASWSAVYMVCQEGDEEDPHSGMLTLINPHTVSTMYMDKANASLCQPFTHANLTFRLRPGQLLMFPSWLMHEVTPYEPREKGYRITVAFNAWFRFSGNATSAPYAGA